MNLIEIIFLNEVCEEKKDFKNGIPEIVEQISLGAIRKGFD